MKQYSFYSVDLLVDGILMEGFSDSNAIITATRDAPQHGKVMDARGKMVAITSADKSGTITFDLLQTSDSNQYLQTRAMQTHDAGTSGGTDVFIPCQVMMNDKMGRNVATGVNGIITMQPGLVRGTGLATDTWVLQFEQLWLVRGQSENVGV
ncbi:virion structural protein [Aeromonas phage ZPAH14]|uniref:Structural protein n=1 Tax=Aeromonas phage ZPAH14 TaxID=2924887 RepID=A0AAE9GXN4_9CAUD|nr:virion structural protein [Aeromonas phage ZPAH14]UOT58043.1 structural protein [Aeromonas phage ZPAH14]